MSTPLARTYPIRRTRPWNCILHRLGPKLRTKRIEVRGQQVVVIRREEGGDRKSGGIRVSTTNLILESKTQPGTTGEYSLSSTPLLPFLVSPWWYPMTHGP